MDKVFHKIKMCIVGNFWFHVFSTFTLIMLTAAFLCPPLAVIDSSILYAASEVLALAALWTVVKAMDDGHTAKFTHKDTTLTITEGEEEGEKE